MQNKSSGSIIKRITFSFLHTLPMALLLGLVLMSMKPEKIESFWSAGIVVAFLFLSAIYFMMHFTGKFDRYRRIFFIVMSVTFVFSFMSNLLVTRGTIILTADTFLNLETEFCPLAIPMVIIPMALSKTIIFPGSIVSLVSMIIIWIGATLVLGKGWCSWGCFFGGLDEAFSLIPFVKRKRMINKKMTLVPYAILIAMVLLSLAFMTPFYCDWLCPFKAVTEFEELRSATQYIQLVIFIALFLALVVILPILTRKRTQCALFCPLGAIQSLSNKINLFDIRINRDKCVDCKICIGACPLMAIDDASLKQGKVKMACSRCGRCVDVCPHKAIFFHIKGKKINDHGRLARNLFVFSAYLFGSVIASGFIVYSVYYLLKLITSGSLV